MAPPRKSRRTPPPRRPSRSPWVIGIAIALVLVLVIAFVIALAGNSGGGGSSKAPPGFDPEIQFALRCAACHGPKGSGGITNAPKLAGGATLKNFPNIDDEVAFVTNGRDGMPAFGKNHNLNATEIRQIVEYTRSL